MKTKQLTRMAAGALALAAVIALGVATAAAQGHTGHTGQQQPQTGQMQSGDMPYDLMFIDMMVMHHQQGIEMARLAGEKGQDARVKALAAKIIADQEKDTAELRGHREHWYAGRPQMDHAQMMSHMQGMSGHQGMQTDMQGDMEKLRAAEGREFDRLFLDMMTMHHQMAIGMSKDAAAKAEHAEIKAIARKTITKQQAEIAEMGRIKTALGGVKGAARKPAPKKKPAAKKPAGHAGHGSH